MDNKPRSLEPPKTQISESPDTLKLRLSHVRAGADKSTNTDKPVISSLHKPVGLPCGSTGELILPPRLWCFACKTHCQPLPFHPPVPALPCTRAGCPAALRAAAPARQGLASLSSSKGPAGTRFIWQRRRVNGWRYGKRSVSCAESRTALCSAAKAGAGWKSLSSSQQNVRICPAKALQVCPCRWNTRSLAATPASPPWSHTCSALRPAEPSGHACWLRNAGCQYLQAAVTLPYVFGDASAGHTARSCASEGSEDQP